MSCYFMLFDTKQIFISLLKLCIIYSKQIYFFVTNIVIKFTKKKDVCVYIDKVYENKTYRQTYLLKCKKKVFTFIKVN